MKERGRWLLALAMVAGAVHADVYKCVDDAGHVTYTNQKAPKGCTLLSKDLPVSSVSGRPAAAPTPASFPKVDGDTQRKRDGERRRILEDELAREEKLLAEARQELADAESKTEGWVDPTRDAQGKPVPGATDGASPPPNLPQVPVGNPRCAERQVLGRDGKTRTVRQCGRNVAGYEEKLKPLQDKIALHERNLEALRKELGNLR